MGRSSILLALFVFVAAIVGPALAGVPRLINYQGILTDTSDIPLDGSYDLTFKIYADSSQAAPYLWSEPHIGVDVDQGLFNVILGGVMGIPDSLFADGERWLGITVAGDPEISPRMQVTSVPWALRAAAADTAAYAIVGADSDWIIAADDMYSSPTGNVGIGTPAPGEKLHVCGNLWVGGAAGVNKTIKLGRYSDAVNCHTIGTLPDANDGLEIKTYLNGHIILNPSGLGKVGIGKPNPVRPLDVEGSVKMTGFEMPTGAAAGYVLTSDGSGVGTWQHMGAGSDGDWTVSGTTMYSAVPGSVGVGTVTPMAKLHCHTTGLGAAGHFEIANPDNDSMAVYAATDGGGEAVYAYNKDSGTTAYLAGAVVGVQGVGTSIYAPAINGYNITNGVGVKGSCGSGNYGWLGTGAHGAFGENATSSNRGHLGGADYGAYGEHGTGSVGYLGGVNYGAYGADSSGLIYGYLGSSTYGVYGRSQTSDGIYGTTWDIAHVGVKGYHGLSGLSGELGAAGFGVYGRGGVNGVGVHGSSNYNYAVSGNSIYGIGVYGTGDSIGVYGYSDDGIAVEGLAGASGAAGYFIGNVDVTGTVTKGGGSFVIDHPLDPENKLLRHNFVESPENLLIYRGKVRLDAGGEALVRLPGYFAALAGEQDATVVLTAVGRPFLTGYDWQSDFTGFTVYGDPGREISWVVYADRDDPVIHKLARPVEETKGPDSRMCERGRLIYPEAYGYPESMGRDYEKRQAAEAQARER